MPGLTVAENILLGRWPMSKRFGVSFIARKEIVQQAAEALEPTWRSIST